LRCGERRPRASISFRRGAPCPRGSAVWLLRYFPTGTLGLGLTALLASFMSGMGALPAAYGVAGDQSIYARSLGININLIWGSR